MSGALGRRHRSLFSFGMKANKKQALIATAFACLLLLVSIALVDSFWVRSVGVRARVFDSNFHILSARVLRSHRDRFYLGNQLDGRVRDFLRKTCHLNVSTLPDVACMVHTSDRCTLVLRYSLRPDQGTLSPLDLELLDPAGTVLPAGGGFNFGRNPYCLSCDLDATRTNADTYRLRIKQAGVYLAELELPGLPSVVHEPFHVGSNAF